ncbi:hypothetical protein [Desulfofalx alkaliphila]|uniref:hypothetical protein n=1 Tax=Desulfofalx alkaliphila TaxID=105483 RepID=UPI00068C1B51|nr:hypothetical protein [Desulfofalx alkaliphila]
MQKYNNEFSGHKDPRSQGHFYKELETLLATDVFKKLLNSPNNQIAQINAAITLLIKAGIPFVFEYTPGTRREEASGELTVYITPTTTIIFEISLGPG